MGMMKCAMCGSTKIADAYGEHYEPHGEFVRESWLECEDCGAKYADEAELIEDQTI